MEIIINGIKYTIEECYKILDISSDNITEDKKAIFDKYGNYSSPTDLQSDTLNGAIAYISKIIIPTIEKNKKSL